MTSPGQELRAFLQAALVSPVPRRHEEPGATVRRRRVVVAATLVVGAVVLGFTVRIPPGDPLFYPAALLLAAVWTIGALVSGPLHLGRAHTRAGDRLARPVVQSLALGVLASGAFLAGALVVGRLPGLSGSADELLDHVRAGSLLAVLAVAAVNGVAEELCFRGAVYAAVPRRRAVAVSTVVYTLATLATGVTLLVVAAGVLGLLTALQRRVTGGVLGPMVTHVTWSTAMVLLLPPVLDAVR